MSKPSLSKEYAASYRAKNRERIRSRTNEWNKANRSKRKHYALKETYNLSLEDYAAMLAAQNNCCKICNKNQSVFKRAMHVDHCHETGKIRGLLCKDCNLLLGRAKDQITTLENAILYLKESIK